MRSKLATSVFAAFGLFALVSGAAAAKVTIAVGGAGCLCYLPTVLAEQLGEYKKQGVDIELVNFKGGSQALTAVIGGSAGLIAAVAALVLGPGIWTAVLHYDAPIFPYQFPTILSLPLAFITAMAVSLARPEKPKASA